MNYTVKEIHEAFANGSETCESLVTKIMSDFENDKKSATPLNAFLELYDDALTKAKACDEKITSAKKNNSLSELFLEKPLFGIPFANKDNISVRGKRLTCGSKILQGYVAPYNATVIARLEKTGAIPLGRCNQDEFAMGSSTEYSAYGATRNPLDRTRVAGGSSGGSAATVSANLACFSLGTETGGSVRLPASYCGVYGLKPTYGLLSRWGVVAYGSSLDQVGVMAHTPNDIARSLSCMAGKDFYDDTSEEFADAKSLQTLQAFNESDFAKLKIALPKQFIENKGMSADVARVFDETKNWFSKKGATIETVDIPVLEAAVASYYVIALAEAASNLSRFDGIRYGARVDAGKGYDELYVETRSEGFGAEVKRRIVIGNYVLSEQFSGDTYKKGMTVRARIQKEMQKLFQSYDMVLCPTCPTAAFKLGEKINDPLEMYLSDLFTNFVNLARNTSLSVPCGKTSDGLPIGIQFIGPMFGEKKILSIAESWDAEHAGCGIHSFDKN